MPDRPDWFDTGLPHIWLPYSQMKTAPLPLPVARTNGTRIVLADGRELVDGMASWWTACHGYNHPHIREAIARQLATMPHVMFGGMVHEQALTLALTAGDEYELVFTAPAARHDDVMTVAANSGVQVTRIGSVVEGSGVAVIDSQGVTMPFAKTGYLHF